MNERRAELYADPGFIELVQRDLVPSLLDEVNLGDDPLHLVAGPAAAAEGLRDSSPRLTIAEFDPQYTAEVAARFAADPAVEVVALIEVEPPVLPFADGRFSAATVVLSLLHLPSTAAQDAALRELARVLRPGAALAGFNAIDGPHFRRLAGDDPSVPMDPMTMVDRLEDAGFVDIRYDLWQFPRFIGRVPLV